MADLQFSRVDLHFLGEDLQFFAAGLLLAYKLYIFLLLDCLWSINYAFFCCWTTFTLEMMVLCTMQPCLPLTEHVQTLYWACADIIDPLFDSFDG